MPFGAKKSGNGGRGGRSSSTRGGSGDRTAQAGQRRSLFRRRKVCKFCADKIDDINYKDAKLLASFVPERAKILPRRISGTCAKHQRKLRLAITRARVLALLPFLAD
jgi:small subunit ribosomal protein S18